MSWSEPDFEAHIRFLTAREGGRREPIHSGYRPNHDLGLPWLSDARHEFIGREWVAPGEAVTARLFLLSPELAVGRLFVGMEFTVQEGPRVVGRGRITRVLNPQVARGAEDLQEPPL